MEDEHFETFASYISSIYREIQRIKAAFANETDVKAVHIFWLYLLRTHPEGLTAAELATTSQTTSSLVSREISDLIDRKLICTETTGDKRRYGWKFQLTDQGRKLADRIGDVAMSVQGAVNSGISQEDLDTFYRVLMRLSDNFTRLDAHMDPHANPHVDLPDSPIDSPTPTTGERA